MAAHDTKASVRILKRDAEFATVAGANCGMETEAIVTEGDRRNRKVMRGGS
jgi:hypothetical protein